MFTEFERSGPNPSLVPLCQIGQRFQDVRERTSMPVTITSLFEQVARERQRKLAPLSDDLVQSGIDLLSFALIVARLENLLG